MSDAFNQLRQIMSNPTAFQQLVQETQQTVEASAPQIAVPTRDVPPPVVVQGTVRFQATFPWESIAGLSLEEVQERVVETLAGERSPWLPQVVLGKMELWQERQLERSASPSGEQGGVSKSDDPYHQSYAGDTDARAAQGEGLQQPE